MAVSINGQDYYASSISFNESIELTNYAALGSSRMNSVTAKAPEGSIDISFYVTTGVEISNITGQYGKTGFVSISGGPFFTTKALLGGFSLAGNPNSLIEGTLNYNYYGGLGSGSASSIGGATIKPAHGTMTSVDVSNMGASSVLDFDYSVNQSYEVRYGLGSTEPQAVNFQEGTRELSFTANLEDVNFLDSSLTGTSGICPNEPEDAGFSAKTASMQVKNICNETISALDISGFIQSRDINASPGEKVQTSINITEFFPNANISGEC